MNKYREVVLDPFKNEFIKEVLSTSVLEEGKLIFKDDQGVPKRNDKNDLITVFEMATKKFESVLNTDNTKQGLGNGDNTKNNSKSSLSLFAASRVPTDFGDIQAIVKAWHLSKGVKIINGSKEMNQGISELRKIYNI